MARPDLILETSVKIEIIFIINASPPWILAKHTNFAARQGLQLVLQLPLFDARDFEHPPVRNLIIVVEEQENNRLQKRDD